MNVGTFAHTTPSAADVSRMEDIDRKAIASCVQANPGLISGFKLRLVGPVVQERGEEVVRLAKEIAVEHGVPLMVHIGDGRAPDEQKASDLTRFMLKTFTEGDILTHLCTPNPGGVMDPSERPNGRSPNCRKPAPAASCSTRRWAAATSAIEVARRQAEMGLHPDTTSSDLTAGGRKLGVGLLDSMAKFMSLGYSLVGRGPDDHRQRGPRHRPGRRARRARGWPRGRHLDHRRGRRQLEVHRHHRAAVHRHQALVPVQTLRAGELFSPDWGPYPWGWLPEA